MASKCFSCLTLFVVFIVVIGEYSSVVMARQNPSNGLTEKELERCLSIGGCKTIADTFGDEKWEPAPPIISAPAPTPDNALVPATAPAFDVAPDLASISAPVSDSVSVSVSVLANAPTLDVAPVPATSSPDLAPVSDSIPASAPALS